MRPSTTSAHHSHSAPMYLLWCLFNDTARRSSKGWTCDLSTCTCFCMFGMLCFLQGTFPGAIGEHSTLCAMLTFFPYWLRYRSPFHPHAHALCALCCQKNSLDPTTVHHLVSTSPPIRARAVITICCAIWTPAHYLVCTIHVCRFVTGLDIAHGAIDSHRLRSCGRVHIYCTCLCTQDR